MVNANERQLRGKNLDGSDQKDAVDHTDYEKNRNPDAELHLDDETDTLYNDGLDVEDDSETLADTHAKRNEG
jgi:hypothetical protein